MNLPSPQAIVNWAEGVEGPHARRHYRRPGGCCDACSWAGPVVLKSQPGGFYVAECELFERANGSRTRSLTSTEVRPAARAARACCSRKPLCFRTFPGQSPPVLS